MKFCSFLPAIIKLWKLHKSQNYSMIILQGRFLVKFTDFWECLVKIEFCFFILEKKLRDKRNEMKPLSTLIKYQLNKRWGSIFRKKNPLPEGSSGRNLAGTETDLFGLLVLIKRKSLQKMRSSCGKKRESPGWSDWKKRRRNRHTWLDDLNRPALKHDVTSQREKTANLIPRSKFRHPVFAFAREPMTLKITIRGSILKTRNFGTLNNQKKNNFQKGWDHFVRKNRKILSVNSAH